MRNFPHIILPTLVLLAVTSCENVNDFDPDGNQFQPSVSVNYLELSSTSVALSANQGSTASLSITSLNTPWQYSGLPEWLSIDATTGNSDHTSVFTATSANTSADNARTAILAFSSMAPEYEFSRSITATQETSEPYININNEGANVNVAFQAPAASQTLTVSANTTWTVNSEGADGWLTIAPSADQSRIVLTTTTNTTNMERNTTITLSNTASTSSATINVTQAKASTPVPSPDSLHFDNKGGAYRISINSEVAWTASSSASWLTITPDKGDAGKTDITVSAVANASTSSLKAFVYITIGTTRVLSIPVSQDGLFLYSGRSKITLSDDAVTDTTAIFANIAWTAVSSDSWLTISPASGTNNGTLRLTAPENTSKEGRTATVTLSSGAIKRTVSVTQEGKYFSLKPTTATINHAAAGGTHSVTLATNDSWTASHTSTWMQLSQSSGSSAATVVMTTPSNTSIVARRDTTTFTPALFSPVRIITIQAGRYLTVDVGDSLRFSARGGTSPVIKVSSDASYTITPSVSWLSVSRSGDTFTVTATQNTSETGRKAEVVVSTTGLYGNRNISVTIPVVQRGKKDGVNITPFTDERLWDIEVGGNATISVTGFGAEKRWD